MDPGEKILLFAHPRSGSSNLFEVLQLHPDLNLCDEPFNENYVDWAPGNKDYLGRVRDRASLGGVLEEIFASYNGLKFLNYQLSDDLVVHLLQRPDLRIVFLQRRNVLQAVVSVLVAEQTQLWHRWDTRDDVESYFMDIRPLDVDEVRQRVHVLARHMSFLEAVVDARRDDRSLKLVYEDFFFAPELEQTRRLEDLWAFLGLPALEHECIGYYLRPEATKLYPRGRYDFLPNAREVNARCGSDETGWLF